MALTAAFQQCPIGDCVQPEVIAGHGAPTVAPIHLQPSRFSNRASLARKDTPYEGCPTVSFADLAYSNMLTLNALVELLDERGILAKRDVLDLPMPETSFRL